MTGLGALWAAMTTAAEKYEQLPERFKTELNAIHGGDPRTSITGVEHFLETAERVQLVVAGLSTAVLLGFFIYWLGMPGSVFNFLAGCFAVFFMGALIYGTLIAALMLVSMICYSLTFKKTTRHQLYWAVNEAFKNYKAQKDKLDRYEQRQEQAHKEAFEKNTHADFEAVRSYFASRKRKGLYMPRSLLKCDPDALAKIALEYAKIWANKAEKSEQERKSDLETYALLTQFLENVDDDDIVEMEDRIANIMEVMSKHRIEAKATNDPLITELTKELARISAMPELQAARARRSERKYWERFQSTFPSASH